VAVLQRAVRQRGRSGSNAWRGRGPFWIRGLAICRDPATRRVASGSAATPAPVSCSLPLTGTVAVPAPAGPRQYFDIEEEFGRRRDVPSTRRSHPQGAIIFSFRDRRQAKSLAAARRAVTIFSFSSRKRVARARRAELSFFSLWRLAGLPRARIVSQAVVGKGVWPFFSLVAAGGRPGSSAPWAAGSRRAASAPCAICGNGPKSG
jgi:hypothetical protein